LDFVKKRSKLDPETPNEKVETKLKVEGRYRAVLYLRFQSLNLQKFTFLFLEANVKFFKYFHNIYDIASCTLIFKLLKPWKGFKSIKSNLSLVLLKVTRETFEQKRCFGVL